MIKNVGGGIGGNVDIRPAVIVVVRNQGRKTIRIAGNGNAAFLGNIDEGSVAPVAIKHIDSGGEPLRSAEYRDSLPNAVLARFGHRSLEVEVYVVCYKQVQIPVLVIIQKGAPRVPPGFFAKQPGLFGLINKAAFGCISIKNVLTVVSDDKVVIPIVVVVSDANALSPPRANQIRLLRHI